MKKKVISTVVTAALSASMVLGTATPAFAGCWTAPTQPISVDSSTTDANGNKTGSVLTAAGHRAAQTLVEILGLDNRACQNMAGNADGQTDGATDQLDPDKRTDITPLEAGNDCKILGVFGSNLNENPDPYYYNYYYNLYANANGLSTTNDAIYCIASSISPNIADTITYNGGVSASVVAKPDILVGASTKTGTGTGQTYAAYIAALRANGDDYDSYNPYVFDYKYNTVYQEGESLQRLATVMDAISSGTQNGSIDTSTLSNAAAQASANSADKKVGRYGDPMVTANDYQLYVKGLSAYVYKEVMAKYGKLKSCVVIDPMSQAKDSNIGSGYFRAYDNTTPTGLAKYARGAECVENATINLASEDAGTADSTSYTDGTDGAAYKVTSSLVSKADVIILQGVQSSYGTMTKDEFIQAMAAQGYDVSNKIIIDSNPQCVYGLTCNSSETALGYGYYMGYIYPDILDPVDAVAFFEDVCMHVTDQTALQKLMDANVSDAVADLSDNSTKLSDNWYDTIKTDIQEGVEYYNNLSKAQQKVFAFATAGTAVGTSFTANGGIFSSTYNEATVNTVLKSDTSLSSATVVPAVSSYTYDGKTKAPGVTVKIGDTVVDSSKYTVSYNKNQAAGKATVTVTAVQGSGYTGSASATFIINKAGQSIKVVTTAKTLKASTLKKASKTFSIGVTAKGTLTCSKASGSKYLSVSKTGTVKVLKGTPAGTYKIAVKIKAVSASNYNAATVTKTITVKVTK